MLLEEKELYLEKMARTNIQKGPIPIPQDKEESTSGWKKFHNQRHRRANIQC